MSYPIHGTYPRFLWEQWVVGTEIEAPPLLSRFLKLTTKILALKKLAGDLAAHRHLIDIITVVQDGQDRFDSVSYSSPMLEVFCRYESLLVRAPYSGVG